MSPERCNICENCTQRLMDTYFFRCQIIKSQETLRLAVAKVSDCKGLWKELIEYSEQASNVNLDNNIGIYSEKHLIQEMTLLLKKRSELLSKTDCEDVEISEDHLGNGFSEDELSSSNKDTNFNKRRKTTSKRILIRKSYSRDQTDTNGQLIKNPMMNKRQVEGKVLASMDKENLQCRVCQSKFLRYSQLKQHMSQHFSHYSCEECDQSFAFKRQFINHMYQHKNGQRYLTKGTEVQRQAAIAASMDTQNRQCRICKETFQNNHLLSVHTNVHFMMYTCDICGRSAATKNRLTRHSLMHKTGTFKCPDCDKVFDKASRLNAHRATKHRGPIHVCPHCNVRFRSFYTRQTHIRDQHSDVFVPHKCTLCEYTTVTSWGLTKHVRTNHARRERAHACGVCDQKFYSESVLRTHMACHSTERPFGCTLCDRSFTRKKTLIQHMKVHKKLYSITNI